MLLLWANITGLLPALGWSWRLGRTTGWAGLVDQLRSQRHLAAGDACHRPQSRAIAWMPTSLTRRN